MKNPIRAFASLLLLAGFFSAQAQTPILNSYPQADAVMFLDFDGHTVAGTSWNYAGPIECGGSGLNASQITEVFHRVAEDYRPFALNVTTDSTRFLSAPVDKRMRVIVTVTSNWYGVAGGVAFVGSFTWGDDTPCFVFSELHHFNVKNISEALSHEAGHTLGLYHQSKFDATCNKITDYDAGQGNGEIGWAPIMGVGYYQNFTTWHNGPNTFGCSNYQNDLEIITSYNGFGYRTDDHSNTFASATVPTFSSNQFNVAGVVEQNTDQDMFRFIMPGNGQFQLDAIPNNVGTGNAGSDLDMQVTLYDGAQNQLSVYNPGMLLSSLVDTFLVPGTYYLRIEGKGNAFGSAYASLGSYSLLGKITNTNQPLAMHHIELKGSQNGDKRQFSWLVDADEKVTEQSLEISTDGHRFEMVTPAAADSRSYIYRPLVSTKAQYRLNVTFDNGHRYYSNVITLDQQLAGARPHVTGTLVNSSSITVSSPGNFNYTVYDYSGRVLQQGKLINGINDVHAKGMIAGLYMIRFEGKDQEWTDKFVRQ